MKLMRIVKIGVNMHDVNLMQRLFRHSISSILTPILEPIQTFLTIKKQ